MKLRIDVRESKIISELQKSTFTFTIEYSNLDLGDFHICDDSDNILLIFERKTIPDLLSSIKDGRYNEQSLRLTHCNVHNHYIYYLLEGPILKFHNETLVYSTICSLSYIKGFSILRTNSIKETINLLANFVTKTARDPRTRYYDSSFNSELSDYCSVIKPKKKDNITPNNMLYRILIQIPSINEKIAKLIETRYTTLHNLLYTIQSDPDDLSNMKLLNEQSGKSRKISKTAINNLIKFLGNF